MEEGPEVLDRGQPRERRPHISGLPEFPAQNWKNRCRLKYEEQNSSMGRRLCGWTHGARLAGLGAFASSQEAGSASPNRQQSGPPVSKQRLRDHEHRRHERAERDFDTLTRGGSTKFPNQGVSPGYL